MRSFKSSQTHLLKEYLFYSSIHDATIDAIEYDNSKRALQIFVTGATGKERFIFLFTNIKCFLLTNNILTGSYKTIASLTVETDYADLQRRGLLDDKDLEDKIYLVFQTACQEEIHIVAQELQIEVSTNTGDGSAIDE